MLDFVMSVIDVLKEIQENIEVNTCNELEVNKRMTTNVISDLSNRQISHWSELSHIDRARLHDAILAREDRDNSITSRLQHLDWNRGSSRIFENRLIQERFEKWAGTNNQIAGVLERARISDPRSDTLKAAQDVLVRRNIALNRTLTINSRIPTLLASCSTRAPLIASNLQDSVD